MPEITLDTPVRSLNGVGDARAKAFARLGIETVSDLLSSFPRLYQERGNVKMLADPHEDGEICSFLLTVSCEPQVRLIRRGMSILKFRAFDESGSCIITYFNQNYLRDVFHTGSQFRFYGKVTVKGRSRELSSPAYEPYIEGRELRKLVPIYPLTEGLHQKYLASLIDKVLSQIGDRLPDYLPESVRLENHLSTLGYAFRNVHHPNDEVSLRTAIRRLMFDELFLFATSIAATKSARESDGAPKMSLADPAPLLTLLPYRPTDAQMRTIEDIRRDMTGNEGQTTVRPMSRIVVGDVGCGKTICAAAAAVMAMQNGYQCAMMVPTEILAVQHYESLAPLFEKLGCRCALLTGSVKAAQKRSILEKLQAGELDFVVGTHALIQDGVHFSALGLVITDEQHRFGVMQRASLTEKSKHTHVLVMSATPIPRTLSLMLYGDLDISRIDEMPPGRQKVGTFRVDETYRERLNGFIRKQIGEGHQVYIVCPSVEEKEEETPDGDDFFDPFSDDTDAETSVRPPLKAAVNYAEELRTSVFPDLRVSFLHGKMKGAEKDAIMNAFSAGETDILVSTTVIEVGVNVPNATLMIVENAERFGLSQLHQLRGRVGRGSAKSYCILVSDAHGENADERLTTMCNTYDGYTIAEKDLALRGPGDFLSGNDASIRQHGGTDFRLASHCDDPQLMHAAFASAAEVIRNDPDLERPENALLKEKIKRLFDSRSTVLN